MSELKAYRFLGQDEVWPDDKFLDYGQPPFVNDGKEEQV